MKKIVLLTAAVASLGVAACNKSEAPVENTAETNIETTTDEAVTDVNAATTESLNAADNALDAASNSVANASNAVDNAAAEAQTNGL